MSELRKVLVSLLNDKVSAENVRDALKELDSLKQDETDTKKRVDALKREEANIGKKLEAANAEAAKTIAAGESEKLRLEALGKRAIERAEENAKSYEKQVSVSEHALRDYADKIAVHKTTIKNLENIIAEKTQKLEEVEAERKKALARLEA